MAIVLKKSVYFPIPRTASEWTRTVLLNCCNVVCEIHGTTDPSSMTVGNGIKKFTFIRHPVTWFQSLYSLYKKRESDRNYTKNFRIIVQDVDLTDFDSFIDGFLSFKMKHFSIDKTNLYRLSSWNYYVDVITKQCDYIGRQEMLKGDLIRMLNEIGEGYDLNAILNEEPTNVSPKRNPISEKAREKIIKECEERMERFGYI